MAAPNWRIEIVKQIGAEMWSNDYLTDDATIEDAQDLAALLQTWERNIHMSVVQFPYIRISTTIPGDRIFRHLDTNLGGLVSTAEYMPLFNTLRVNFGTADSDPGRKYYRCPLAEGNQANGNLDALYMGQLGTKITTFLVTPGVLPHIVTPKGNTVVSASIFPQVQIRQLHRRRKKKLVP